MGGLTHEQVEPFVVMGELALDGACTPVPGALPAAMAARDALFVPSESSMSYSSDTASTTPLAVLAFHLNPSPHR